MDSLEKRIETALDETKTMDGLSIEGNNFKVTQFLALRGLLIEAVNDRPLSLNEYQSLASRTMTAECDNREYLGLSLVGEAGEVAGKLAKIRRGDGSIDAVIKEMGDVLWFLSQLAEFYHVPFQKIAEMNLEKLADRQKRGVIAGSGDDR